MEGAEPGMNADTGAAVPVVRRVTGHVVARGAIACRVVAGSAPVIPVVVVHWPIGTSVVVSNRRVANPTPIVAVGRVVIMWVPRLRLRRREGEKGENRGD